MTPLLSLEEAQSLLLDGMVPLGSETVRTQDANGRWLAEPVIAQRTSPAADLSAMDGFATAGPGPWTVVGESAAGHPFQGLIRIHEAVRISTGAHVPRGAEAILLREDSAETEGSLAATGDQPSARHIRRAGFDFHERDTLLSPGTLVGAAQLALAMAAGLSSVIVGRRPQLAVMDTGDELTADPTSTARASIPATNGPMLGAFSAGLVARWKRIGPVPDNRRSLRTALESAEDADVIVTSGGASVGDHDLVRPVLEEWGAAIEFWRVAIRPGKPLLVARRGHQTIVGLPGNPASAFVTAVLFVLPLLRRLAGASLQEALPRTIPAVLGASCPAGGPRREFLRARWSAQGIVPLAERDSSAQQTLAAADALIDRQAGAPAAGPGEIVRVVLF